jgi:hypothetical protein
VRSSPTQGEAPFWEALEVGSLTAEQRDKMHDFVASAIAAPGCEVRWLKTCLVDLPGVVPQKTLLTINKDGSIQLNLACWKPKEAL